MAISPPNFQKDAVPTPQGWRHPRTNELLVSRKLSAEDINEYYGIKPEVLSVYPIGVQIVSFFFSKTAKSLSVSGKYLLEAVI